MKKYHKQEALGALLAAIIPSVMYCLLMLIGEKVSFPEVIWSLLFMLFFSAFFVFSLGWLGYDKLLKKNNVESMFWYAIFGSITGAMVYLVFYFPYILGFILSDSDHSYLMVEDY